MGIVKKTCENVEAAIIRLDKRINGTFASIAEHLKDSPKYRADLEVLKIEVKNMKEEKHNTTKASQWRIGLIVGGVCSLPSFITMIVNLLRNGK